MNKISKEKQLALFLESLDSNQIVEILLNKLSNQKISLTDKRKIIPLSIFTNDLSILENIVKYLKEDCNYKYSQIGKILGRNERTIWTTYQKSLAKNKSKLKINFSDYDIPITILKKKKLSALESISVFLKDTLELGFTDIARLIGRNPKTIWTSYKRAQEK